MPLVIPPDGGGAPPLNPLALLIWGVLSTFADAVEDVAIFALNIFGTLSNTAYDTWNALTDQINILADSFLGFLPVWDFFQRVVDAVFESITAFVGRIGITFREIALWANRIRDVRNRLVDVVTAIVDWIDAQIAGVIADLLALAAALLDPVGRFLANLYGLLRGTTENPWDWIRANTPDIWTAFDSLFQALWWAAQDWLFATLTTLGGFLFWLASAVLDPVGRFLANLYGLLRGDGSNPWDWIRLNTPDIWTAFDSLFQALWWAFLDWLNAALAGILSFLPDIALWLDFLRDVGANIRAFLDNPWEYLFALARGRLWPLVERWLIEVWDGAA